LLQVQNKQKFNSKVLSAAGNHKFVRHNTPDMHSLSNSLVFRILRPADADALRRLRHRAIQECPEHFGTPPDIELGRGTGYYRRQLLAARLRGQSRILGVFQGPNLVGMAGVRHRHTLSKPYGLIYSMYLIPEHRGKGNGRALLEEAQNLLIRLWKVDTFQMNVEIHNLPALSLYESCGFRILRTDSHAFRINGVDFDVHLLEKRLV